jgi:hypothetical protein
LKKKNRQIGVFPKVKMDILKLTSPFYLIASELKVKDAKRNALSSINFSK